MKSGNLAVLLLFLGLCGASFYIGFISYPKIHKAPQTALDTLYIYDTSFITIPNDTTIFYQPSDTIYLIDTNNLHIDTAFVLKDYYNTFLFDWTKVDSNILIKGKTTVNMNRIKSNELTYQWKKPLIFTQNITENKTFYNNYLSIGFDIPFNSFKTLEIETNYTFNKGYFGIGFTPEYKAFTGRFGFNVLSFRGRGILK